MQVKVAMDFTPQAAAGSECTETNVVMKHIADVRREERCSNYTCGCHL